MAQVLVPVYISELDSEENTQHYRYFEESEVPKLNRFNVGDKVRFSDDYALEDVKTGERFKVDVEHTHLIKLVSYNPATKEYSYWVKIDPVLRHCGEKFQDWCDNGADDENDWHDWFSEDELTSAKEFPTPLSLEALLEEAESPHYQVGDRVGSWLVIGQSYSFLFRDWYYTVVPAQVCYIIQAYRMECNSFPERELDSWARERLEHHAQRIGELEKKVS
ncbi:hypothetical protein BI308_01325 [Roseofilum reptotaenium AO1-A]|uniref:Uncharacterized protein n=1 Tax=Roseofilum reptotaenium AO1-A TaxID=1925591 RepID=A0A1L9QY90_9CYAN|nr:hypothetical protein BI308_01325 [Roseofilum reptotaenium AO1-A]